MAQLTMVKAINLALAEAMRADERVLVLGQDVGVDEGVFRITEGLLREFGPNRCIDTPLAEAAIVGAGIGLAITGFLPSARCSSMGSRSRPFTRSRTTCGALQPRAGGTPARWFCMPYGGGIRAVEHHA